MISLRRHPWLLVLVLCLAACGGSGEEVAVEEVAPADSAEVDPAETEPGAEMEPDAAEEVEITPLSRREVRLFFPSAIEDGLIAEPREIFNTVTPGDRIKQLMGDLISGPTSPEALRAIPPGTQLRQVFVLDDGVAYLDFTEELADGMRGGSRAEILTVYSIVDSVVVNIPEVSKVAILVGGRPLETPGGHLDLRRPLPADTSLILGTIVVSNRPGPGFA